MILRREKYLDYLVNITIPASFNRNERIPHIALICEYPRLTSFILNNIFNNVKDQKKIYLKTMGSDLGNMYDVFSNIENNTVLCLQDGNSINKFDKDMFDIFKKIVLNFGVEIPIGSDVSSKNYYYEFPYFSFVACFESSNQLSSKFKTCFDYVINVCNFTKKDFCWLEVKALLKEYDIACSNDFIDEIIQSANEDYHETGRYVTLLRDYLFVNNKNGNDLSQEDIIKVSSLFW